jgi:cation transporter-like permease
MRCPCRQVIHPNLAKGLFNAGLMTTEAGTLGRFSGNIVMSLIARLTGVETNAQLVAFASTLYGLFAALLALIALYMAAVWRRLAT